jgi:hypothetical protein
MEQRIELPQGLNLVRGLNHEKVLELLNEAGIKYKMNWEPSRTSGYFRSSYFVIDSLLGMSFDERIGMSGDKRARIREKCGDNLLKVLGFSQHLNLDTQTYFATYRIMEDFDFSILSGKVTFDEGRLVERVRVCIE